jgi:hypothetical protein
VLERAQHVDHDQAEQHHPGNAVKLEDRHATIWKNSMERARRTTPLSWYITTFRRNR